MQVRGFSGDSYRHGSSAVQVAASTMAAAGRCFYCRPFSEGFGWKFHHFSTQRVANRQLDQRQYLERCPTHATSVRHCPELVRLLENQESMVWQRERERL